MTSNSLPRRNIRRLVVIGALGGISMFLGFSGIGLIKLPIFSITIMHIPVIIGAILEGPVVGAIVGLIFGLFSMYDNFTTPRITSFIFYNPIIALLPRICIGLVAHYTYKFFKGKSKNNSLSIGISSVLATLTNTVGVLGLTYLIYLQRYAEARNLSPSVVGTTLLTVGLTNGVPEAIVSALIAIPVISALIKIKKS